MNDSEQSLGRSIKMILGTLGIFVVFGFLALILSGFAGNESAEDRAYKGEFSEETTKVRWANLEEIETAQTEAFDPTKVDAALKKIGSTVAKPTKTAIVVPGSPTFLKQAEQKPADAPADTEKSDPKEVSDSPAIEPKAPGAAAPDKDAPKPGPVDASEPEAKEKADAKPKADPKPKSEEKPKADVKPKGEAKPKDNAKAKAKSPEQPESKPAPAKQ